MLSALDHSSKSSHNSIMSSLLISQCGTVQTTKLPKSKNGTDTAAQQLGLACYTVTVGILVFFCKALLEKSPSTQSFVKCSWNESIARGITFFTHLCKSQNLAYSFSSILGAIHICNKFYLKQICVEHNKCTVVWQYVW